MAHTTLRPRYYELICIAAPIHPWRKSKGNVLVVFGVNVAPEGHHRL